MKKFENVFMIVVVILLSFTMFSYGDDDETVGNPDDLIGTWSIIKDEGYEKYDGKNHPWDETYVEGKETLVFKADHTFGGVSDPGTWSYKESKLTLDYDEGDKEAWTVLELTSTRLVMEYHEKDGGDEYYNKLTCKK